MCFHASSSWTSRMIIALNFEDSITVTIFVHSIYFMVSSVESFFTATVKLKRVKSTS